MQHIIEQWKGKKRTEFKKWFSVECKRTHYIPNDNEIEDWWLSQLPSLLTLLEEGVGLNSEDIKWVEENLKNHKVWRTEGQKARVQVFSTGVALHMSDKMMKVLSEVKQQFN